MIKCTDHFYKRCKERLGINKKASLSLLEKAVINGITFEDVRHMAGIRNYVYRICKSTNNKNNRRVRIYKHYIVIIAIEGKNVLGVTIHNIPPNLCLIVDKIYKKRKEKETNGYGTITTKNEGHDQST